MTVAVALVASISAALLLQQPRDAARSEEPEDATGTVAGRVTEAGTDRPLPQAVVTLRRGGLSIARSVVTDSSGAFAFTDVPPGRIALTASKPAYLQVTRLGTASESGGTTVNVRSGGNSDVLLHMKRGAVIAGTIRTPLGEPMPDLPVYVFAADSASAQQSRPSRILTHTDDRGMYRVFGLPRGAYFVATTVQTAGLGLLSVIDATAATERLLSSRQGSSRGATVISMGRELHYSYAPAFYPGTSVPSQAQPVFVRLGDSREDVDFSVGLVRAVRVAGAITMPDGAQPARRLRVALLSHGRALAPRDSSSPRDVSPPGPAAFVFDNVPPGRYTIVAHDTGAARPGTDQPLFGTLEIDVAGEDVLSLSVPLRPTLNVSGRVQTRGWLMKPPDLSSIRVVLTEASSIGVSVVADDARGFSRTAQANVSPDGSFEVRGLPPGRYVVNCVVPGGRWTLNRGLHGDVDVLDIGLELSASDIAGLNLELVDLQTELTGLLTEPSGAPAQGYVVAAFPAEQRLRSASRRIQMTQTDADGAFSLQGLPAGNYLLAVVSDLSAEEILEPDTLNEMERVSVAVTLAEGQKVRQDFAIQTDNTGGSAGR